MQSYKLLALILSISLVCVLLVIHIRTPIITKERSGWSIGFGFYEKLMDGKNISENEIFSKYKMRQLNDSTSFIADPFFIKKDSIFYIFFEHQKTKSGADVGLLKSNDGFNYSYEGTVLDEDFHLSYPQIFEYKGSYFMIPESQASNHVLLYKSFNFPNNWKIVDTLIANTKLKDPTIYLSDSLNIIVGSDNNMRMYMYYSDSLNGNWRPHEDFIVMRGTESRPGGRFIPYQGGLVLPVQNSTHGYGYGISLYKFKFKNLKYRYEKISHLYLKRNNKIKEFNSGMHHIDIQFIEDKFYAVYDGNSFKEDADYSFNIKGPLKWNYIDLSNWLNSYFKR